MRYFLAALLLFAAAGPLVAEEPGNVVSLVVDYGDGVQKHFTQLEWREKMTVEDALNQAAAHPRGIRIETRGRADTAFLTAIDDVKNEGSGRNWLYKVNGEKADRSIGIMPLSAGDAVLWEFRAFR